MSSQTPARRRKEPDPLPPHVRRDVVVGFDWDEEGGWYAVVGEFGAVLDVGEVNNTPDGVAALLRVFDEYTDALGRKPALTVEATRRPMLAALADAGIHVRMISANLLHESTKVKGRRKPKTDRADAIKIATRFRSNAVEFHPLPRPSGASTRITLLAREEVKTGRYTRQLAARVRSLLVEYYPAPLLCWSTTDLADDEVAARVLLAAPTPPLGKALSLEDIVEIVRSTGKRSFVEKEATDAHAALQRDLLRYSDHTAEAAYGEALTALLPILIDSIQHRKRLEKLLKEEVKKHPFYDLLSPAVGTGFRVLSRLIGEVTDDPERFKRSTQLAAFAATAPVPIESHSRGKPVRREVKGNALHRAMWDWAEVARMRSPGAMQYYWVRRDKGDQHPTAIRKVAYKLTVRAHHCIRTGAVWDEQTAWTNAPTLEEARAYAAEVRAKLAARRPPRKKRNLPELTAVEVVA